MRLSVGAAFVPWNLIIVFISVTEKLQRMPQKLWMFSYRGRKLWKLLPQLCTLLILELGKMLKKYENLIIVVVAAISFTERTEPKKKSLNEIEQNVGFALLPSRAITRNK